MRNIKLEIQYDGTNFYGWQIQPNKRTVQGDIKKALELFLQEDIKLIGASRTDKGVHARHQVANFKTNSELSTEEIKYKLNQLLDNDILIFNAIETKFKFHARYWAKKKKYRYFILNSYYPSPFYRNYSWFYNKKLDLELLNKVAKHIIGKKDFKAFQGQGSDMKETEREIFDAKWYKKNDFIIFSITGSGFLKNMVRKLVGSFIAINENLEKKDFLLELLESKDRQRAKYMAPPQGLFLEKIIY